MAPREGHRQDDVGAHRLHVRTFGDDPGRPPVVLVHGFVISSLYMVPFARALAPRFRVLAPDLPGFGRSDKPREALDVAKLADVLGAWMAQAGLAGAPVATNSFGCQVVVELAARRPDLVGPLVLVGPTMDPSAGALGQAARLLADVPRERLSMWPLHAPDMLRAGPRRALATYRHALAHPMRERLAHVRSPTLVVRGTRDPIVTPAWAREVAARLPRGRLETIPGPHALNYSRPEALAALAAPFLLRGVDAPPAP